MQRFPARLMRRPYRLFLGLAGIVLIAWADRSLSAAIPLALLYLVPVTLMSTALQRWQIPILGLICTYVAEFADAFPWTVREGIPRDTLYLFAYTAAGLYVHEVLSRRRVEAKHLAEVEAEVEARRGAEEQLRLVVANSSIAIITSDETGTILQANETAERIFGANVEGGERGLQGSSLKLFLPALARVQIRRQGWTQLRTMMQCQGTRANHEPFLADVWMSSYVTSRGGRLTAMIVDSSTDLRDREDANLEQVLVGSKLALGAMFHEIRNVCAAIAVVEQNLRAAEPAKTPSEDFDALRQLVTALERMASMELSMVKRQPTRLNLEEFLRELRIILTPSLREKGIELVWLVDESLPEVWADPQSLLQVFLNLVRNAEHALRDVDDGRLTVRTDVAKECVSVRVIDNGPGVSQAARLFRPFESGSNLSGLGLYLSRAMMMSFRGDLSYEPKGPGATFLVELIPAEVDL